MMDSVQSFVSPAQQQFARDLIQYVAGFFNRYGQKEDAILLPLIALGAAYVFNRGSVLPKRNGPYHYKMFERPQEHLGISREASTRNVADKIQEVNADLVIFWGSQSGVAEGLASRLAREFKHRFKLMPLVADLSDYEPETIAKIPSAKLALFIMSTYGEGDPSDNAVDFVNWLGRQQKMSLANLRYAAFGCGNKNYRLYNKVIDDVTTGLKGLGAMPLVPTGRGDEAARTTEEDLVEWKEKLFNALKSQLGLQEYEIGYEEGVKVIPDESGDASLVHISVPITKPTFKDVASTKSSIIAAPILFRREIGSYSDENRSCVHIEIDLSAHRQIKYRTGDHLAVWPVNPTEDVQALLGFLSQESRKDNPIRIISCDQNDDAKVPSPTTISALLTHHLEICSPVPRETLHFLSEFASTEKVKGELKRIAKDKQTYNAFLEHDYLTISRLLSYTLAFDPTASWANLPLSFIIDVLPAIKPRTYSIASSPVKAPRHVHLAISVKPTELVANPKITIPGLASTYLSTLPYKETSQGCMTNGPLVHVQVRPSTFKLPVNLKVPVIMVAAGTGIAPFRAFIHDRGHVASVGREVGPMFLFFGCQNTNDYLYEDEFTELQKGSLAGKLDLNPAFSRSGKQKQYVNDVVNSRAAELGRLLLEEDAAFFICGSAIMAKTVRDVMREAVKSIKGWTDDQAEDWRLERKKSNRWFEDAWS